MSIRGIDRAIRRTFPLVFMANATLSLLWLTAAVTPWLNPMYGSQAGAETASMAGAGPVVPSVTEAAVRDATTGKAIFRTNRQVEEKVVDELGRYQLRGVTNGSSGARAYIRDTQRKRTLCKEAGEMLDVFEIVDVRRDGVVLRRAGEEVLLAK
jgi:hypothetical protein